MIKKILKITALVLSFAVFVMCMVSFVVIIISSRNNTVPSFLNHSVLSLLTKSMEPTYKVGDLVVVKKVDASELKEGDVISFYSTAPDIYGMPNTHRINKIEKINGELVFTTKGDNNDLADFYSVKEGKIIGRVVFKIPFLGKAVRYLQTTKAAYFLVVILPILVIFFFEMRNVIVKYREVKKDNENENN